MYLTEMCETLLAQFLFYTINCNLARLYVVYWGSHGEYHSWRLCSKDLRSNIYGSYMFGFLRDAMLPLQTSFFIFCFHMISLLCFNLQFPMPNRMSSVLDMGPYRRPFGHNYFIVFLHSQILTILLQHSQHITLPCQYHSDYRQIRTLAPTTQKMKGNSHPAASFWQKFNFLNLQSQDI